MIIKERIAKAIRIVSVPPIMISMLILILAFNKNNIFRNSTEIIIMIVLLGLVPALAYVLSSIIPEVKAKGREGQRKLAFITNLVGYSMALSWAVLTNVKKELLLICLTYFLSVVFLTICNKGFHFRASGHASSFTGPLILMIYFLGWESPYSSVSYCCIYRMVFNLFKTSHHKRTGCGNVSKYSCVCSFYNHNYSILVGNTRKLYRHIYIKT